jgi:hypothetical protein
MPQGHDHIKILAFGIHALQQQLDIVPMILALNHLSKQGAFFHIFFVDTPLTHTLQGMLRDQKTPPLRGTAQ